MILLLHTTNLSHHGLNGNLLMSMNRISSIAIVLIHVLVIGSSSALQAAEKPAGKKSERPNFVFILGEGQGWASTSVQIDPTMPASKSESFTTPSLERLSRQGMRFTNFYAPSPRCTPSRATFFTGLSPAQLHMTFTSPGGDTGRKVIEPRIVRELPGSVTTIAEILKKAGYATAHFGKWHVGRTDPKHHGFDESDGPTQNGGPDNSRNPNPKQAYGMAKRGMDFMQRQVDTQTPFYLQLSQYGGKSEADARRETYESVLKSGLGRNEKNMGAAAVALDMDITIGMVLDKLDELGISDNTYVFYTADHGTSGRNGPLKGGKGGLWDGGIRIPLFICGPTVPIGVHSDTRVTGADFLPTIAELAAANATLSEQVEGGSLTPVFADPNTNHVKRPREELVFHFPHYDKDSLGPVSAIIIGDHKLIRVYEDGRRLLFDLSKDIGEQNDLSASLPDRVQELDERLSKYLSDVGAQLPMISSNPAAEHSRDNSRQPRTRRDGRRGKGGRKGGKTLGEEGAQRGDRRAAARDGN